MFRVGQEVICIKTHPEGVVKKGEIYRIKGFKTECKCGLSVDVGILDPDNAPGTICGCLVCRTHDIVVDGKWWLAATRFAPVADISELQSILNQEKVTA